mmetsp:Transcript_5518/g.5945  ORF Transcript_5518/g.5945 Transcript_5518/m.5945 type:complete len:286 (-) Transcript_5518:331-1188(-)
MRRRSCAFHAASNEEYIKLATDNQDTENYFYNNSSALSKDCRNKRQYSIESETYSRTTYADFSHENDDNEFEENTEFSQNIKNSPSTSSMHKREDSAIDIAMRPGSEVKKIKIECMLLGTPGVGKHALINSQFPAVSDLDSSSLMKRMDLIIRETDSSAAATEASYKFWISELVDDTYNTFVNLYMKRCSVIVYVYDMTCRESFESVEKEIMRVRELTGKTPFCELLLAMGSDKIDQRTVQYEEGVTLQVRYNLQHFCETDISVECQTQQFLRKLESVASTKVEA